MNHKYADIFGYSNFRKFLKDYQYNRNTIESEFSKSHFCRLLGLPNSRSYFREVLTGRAVTSKFVDKFISVMGLKGKESMYFRALVNYNQANSKVDRDIYKEQLYFLKSGSF
ncbi:MAG: TIGR02147 family protein [Fibrobacteria bacterium]|nr:TIGR02147 family protein [Fibrobacteria bacterium]